MYLQSCCENQLLALPCPSYCLYEAAGIPLDWFSGNFKVGFFIKSWWHILILIEITEKKHTLHKRSCSYVFVLYVIMHFSLWCKTGSNASCLYLLTFFFCGINHWISEILEHSPTYSFIRNSVSPQMAASQLILKWQKWICGCNNDQL